MSTSATGSSDAAPTARASAVSKISSSASSPLMLANSILLTLSDCESSADARTLPPRGGQRRAAHRARGPGVHGAGLKAPRFRLWRFHPNRDVSPKGTRDILLNPAFSVQNSLVRASSSLLLYFAQVNPAGTEFTRLSSTVLKRKPLTRNSWAAVRITCKLSRVTCLAVHVIRHHCDVIRGLARGRHVLRASFHVLRAWPTTYYVTYDTYYVTLHTYATFRV